MAKSRTSAIAYILSLPEGGGVSTIKDWQKAFGVNLANYQVKKLIDDGLVTKTGRNKYRLTEEAYKCMRISGFMEQAFKLLLKKFKI